MAVVMPRVVTLYCLLWSAASSTASDSAKRGLEHLKNFHQLDEEARLRSLSELKRTVESLVDEQSQTPDLDPEVNGTLGKMKAMFNNTIYPSIIAAHNLDQTLVNNAYTSILTFVTHHNNTDHQLQVFEMHLSIKKTKVVNQNATVQAHLADASSKAALQGGAHSVMQDACCERDDVCPNTDDQCDMQILSKAYVGCNFATQSAADCNVEADNLIASLKSYFDMKKKTYDTKEAACQKGIDDHGAAVTAYTTAYVSYESEVDYLNDLIREYNVLGTWLMDHANSTCAELRANGTVDYDSFGDTVDAVLAREATRAREWNATQTIECMIEKLMSDAEVVMDDMKECEENVDPWDRTIDIPTPPNPVNLTCTVPENHTNYDLIAVGPQEPSPSSYICSLTKIKAEYKVIFANTSCPDWCAP